MISKRGEEKKEETNASRQVLGKKKRSLFSAEKRKRECLDVRSREYTQKFLLSQQCVVLREETKIDQRRDKEGRATRRLAKATSGRDFRQRPVSAIALVINHRGTYKYIRNRATAPGDRMSWLLFILHLFFLVEFFCLFGILIGSFTLLLFLSCFSFFPTTIMNREIFRQKSERNRTT
jgi:hypothetical protein